MCSNYSHKQWLKNWRTLRSPRPLKSHWSLHIDISYLFQYFRFLRVFLNACIIDASSTPVHQIVWFMFTVHSVRRVFHHFTNRKQWNSIIMKISEENSSTCCYFHCTPTHLCVCARTAVRNGLTCDSVDWENQTKRNNSIKKTTKNEEKWKW